MKLSNFLSLNAQDFLKGLLMAVLGAVVAVVGPAIETQTFVFNWTIIWHTAAATAFSYLTYRFVSPTPKIVQIDPSKTSVIDKDTKEVIVNAKN